MAKLHILWGNTPCMLLYGVAMVCTCLWYDQNEQDMLSRIRGPKLLGSTHGFHICCTPTSPKRTKCGNLGLMYVTERSCSSRIPRGCQGVCPSIIDKLTLVYARAYALASYILLKSVLKCLQFVLVCDMIRIGMTRCRGSGGQSS